MKTPMHPPKFYRTRRFWLKLLIVGLLIGVAHHFYVKAKHHVKKEGQPVVLAQAKTADVPVYLSALGTVTPTNSVTIKPQVSGELCKIYFKEGQEVKAGDLLAEIDSRPFEAQVLQFEGQLARDQALLANAQIDLKRYQTLYKLKSVSQQIFDTQKALVKQLEGTLKVDQGQLDNAKVNLGFCKITSPIDGRVGLKLIDEGNYVQSSTTTGIAVVNSLNPIKVSFSLPEDDVSQVAPLIYSGTPLTTKAYDRTQSQLLDTGVISSLDNQIDPTTGTVKLMAEFPNKNNTLFPNQFVNIKLLIKTLLQATIVPTAAIQQGVNGPFVYIANANNTVTLKSVTTGTTDGDNTVVKELTPGQSVVVEGADKLTDGATIK